MRSGTLVDGKKRISAFSRGLWSSKSGLGYLKVRTQNENNKLLHYNFSCGNASIDPFKTIESLSLFEGNIVASKNAFFLDLNHPFQSFPPNPTKFLQSITGHNMAYTIYTSACL